MSKLVNWGRWVVATLFAFLGVVCLWHTVITLPFLVQVLRGPEQSFFIDSSIILWIPFLLSAWGIWQWRRWGYVMTTTMCALFILQAIHWLIKHGVHGLRVGEILILLSICSILAWLLLPPVRVQYFGRSQIA